VRAQSNGPLLCSAPQGSGAYIVYLGNRKHVHPILRPQCIVGKARMRSFSLPLLTGGTLRTHALLKVELPHIHGRLPAWWKRRKSARSWHDHNQSLLKAVTRLIGESGKATLVGAPDADILAAAMEILRKRIAAGTATFLGKVKAHRGEPANEGANILADKAIPDPKVGKECCQRTFLESEARWHSD